MKRTSLKTRQLCISISAVLLAACGTNDKITPTPVDELANDVISRGKINNLPISGLTYRTATQQGVSNDNGEFLFKEGETIQFSLANYELASIEANESIDFFALMNTSHPTQRQLNAYLDAALNRGSDAATNRALNLALLLQSLDADDDLSNGINISSSDLSGLSSTDYKINFADNSDVFIANLRRVFKQAGLQKPPQKPLNMIRDLVNSDVISTPLYRVSHYESDTDADGTANRIYYYEYDSQGNVVRQSTDSTADGNINTLSTYRFDVNGNNIEHRIDSDNNGIAEQTYTFSYDSHGNQLWYAVDNDNDDALEYSYTFTFDQYGNQLTYERDGNNNRVDDIVDSRYTSIFNEWGDKVRYKIDSNADGDIETLYIYTYDEKGNRVKYQTDNGADGVPDSIYTYQYDSQGNRTYAEFDTDGDGVANNKQTYVYDELGNRVQHVADTNADGSANTIYTYVFDENGNLIRQKNDSNADGTSEVEHAYGYDDAGNQEGYHIEIDGAVDRSYVSQFDDAGNKIKTFTINHGGVIVSTETYIYESTTAFSRAVTGSGESER